MPNIKTYDQPQLGIRPTEAGVEATAAAARRGNAFFTQAAGDVAATGHMLGSALTEAGKVASDYVEHKNVSDLAAKSATFMATYSQKWNDFASDPNIDPRDPSLAAEFRDKVLEPGLEKFKEGAYTQAGERFAETFVDHFRNHMVVTQAADMSARARVGAHLNIMETANMLGVAVYNDPALLNTAMTHLHNITKATLETSPTIDPGDKSRLSGELNFAIEEKLVNTAAQGAIAKGGDWHAIANQYPQYIKPGELAQFERAEDHETRTRRNDERWNKQQDLNEKKDKSEEAANQYIVDIYSKNPRIAGDVQGQKILHDETLLPSTRSRLLGLMERELKPETDKRISAEAANDILKGMRTGTDPDELMDRAWKARLKGPGEEGSMTEHDFNMVRGEIDHFKTPDGSMLAKAREDFFHNFSSAIDAGLPHTQRSALGEQQIYAAKQAAIAKEEELLKTHSAKTVMQMLYGNPKSPDFFGNSVSQFHVNLQNTIDYAVQMMGLPAAGAPPTAAKPSAPPKELTAPEGATMEQMKEMLPPGTYNIRVSPTVVKVLVVPPKER